MPTTVTRPMAYLRQDKAASDPTDSEQRATTTDHPNQSGLWPAARQLRAVADRLDDLLGPPLVGWREGPCETAAPCACAPLTRPDEQFVSDWWLGPPENA